ncbi:dynein Light Chain family member [Loa loa]|uniref:Dynein light chain n=1 Tax=Loa loa TaxID=7209 RepID=A0A1S0TH80_LOALO|nr:dynein Light Chain family member [Loa loa]EFO13158.1 dynein Light Chain family member [Loa loa]
MVSNRMEVKETDMESEMVQKSMAIALEARKQYSLDKDMALYIKQEFERRFGPTWHCVVGKSFGSSFSYEIQHFILLKLNQLSIIIFKCGY